MTASFQAQHIIPGDRVHIAGEEQTVMRVEPLEDMPGTTRIFTDGYRWTFPDGKLVTVTEAAPRPRRA